MDAPGNAPDAPDPDAVASAYSDLDLDLREAAAPGDGTRPDLERLLHEQQVQTRSLLEHLRHLRQVLPRVDELAARLRETPLPAPVAVAAMDLLLAVENYDEAAHHSRLAAADPAWSRHVGPARVCPCCGERSAPGPRAGDRCATCDATPADRLLWTWVVSRTDVTRSRARVLHVGGAPAIRAALARCPDVRLVPADLVDAGTPAFQPGWTVPIADDALDLVLCDRPPWDVLDRPAAVDELGRALTSEGALVCVLDSDEPRGPDRDLAARLRVAGFDLRVEALPGYAAGPLGRRCGFDPHGVVLAVERRSATGAASAPDTRARSVS